MIIVSGLSGAGKTVALHTLEDLGYYCIDNLPSTLLPALYKEQLSIKMPVAVGIDIRNQTDHIKRIPEIIKTCKQHSTFTRLLLLTANKDVLVKRFSESRRKHPLSTPETTLPEAIEKEIRTLSPLFAITDYQIDTSTLSIYDLKDRIRTWLQHNETQTTAITIESFGFKYGTPTDVDLLLDVRFLPNPYWESTLRQFTGQDQPIQNYLSQFTQTNDFIADTSKYLTTWLPPYLNGHRSYLTIGIGCTGGKHRSVYVSEQLAKQLSDKLGHHINIRHRDLPQQTQKN